MDKKIIEKLAIAEQFSHNAQYAGVPRQAVADGYSSIDALYSAVLLSEGIKVPFNHKAKLDLLRATAPAIFAARREKFGSGYTLWGGIEWSDIEAFYSEWLKSRYEAFDMSASLARSRVGTTLSANNLALRWLADKHGENWSELRSEVMRAAYGYNDSKISEELCRAHDYLFSEAEAYGERVGRKLGIKMASATNFCGADIIAGDEVTRRLIEHDQKIADHAAEVYISFCRLMEEIRGQRVTMLLAENPQMKPEDALSLGTEFMLSMKAKYHGEQLSQTGKSIAQVLEAALNRFEDDLQIDD